MSTHEILHTKIKMVKSSGAVQKETIRELSHDPSPIFTAQSSVTREQTVMPLETCPFRAA